MGGQKLSGIFSAASLVMAMLFTGNWLAGRTQAVQIEVLPPETEVTEAVTEATTAPTIPTAPPETTAPDKLPGQRLACEEAAQEIQAGYVFVYDLCTDRMIYSSTDVADKLYPASITKLYSAFVGLMYLEPDAVITAGEELSLVQPGSSVAYISKGSRLTVEMLIEGMLLPSGNDAAYIVAAAAGREIAGDPKLDPVQAVQIFVAEMNREAFRLGMVNSKFTNPDGYHAGGHYTCPEDAALIGSLALNNPIIAKYIGMLSDSVRFESGEKITWSNTNRLLNPESEYYVPSAVGMKTGYTSEAGYCLLAAFCQGEEQYLVGIFDAETKLSRYSDAAKLLEACK